MTVLLHLRTLIAVLALAFAGAAFSQGPSSRSDTSPAAAPVKKGVEVLRGTWVRPDGGYRIVINGVDASGQIDAMYFNPSQLPFARAKVSQVGSLLRVVLELQAGGYAGSIYDLVYEPTTDRLQGSFYQAVAKQKFDVFFVRK